MTEDRALSSQGQTGFLNRMFALERSEAPAVFGGAALFFLLFTGYFMLRPVRETMGIAGGVNNLQWLFTATFVATLAALPLFGWLASRVARRRILVYTYGFFVVNLLVFAVGFAVAPDAVWQARAFYVWLSVFNLLAISLGWSLLADLFSAEQAQRLFGLVAAGASLGGLCGPLLGTLLVGSIGHVGLMLMAALFLAASAVSASGLQRWRERNPLPADLPTQRRRPLGGHPLEGASELLKSRFLQGIALFVVLLASVSTFLYFEQARLVAETFPDPVRQTQVFGTIDVVVQTLAIITQLFFTGRLARRLGVGALLVAVPLLMAVCFAWLAVAPAFAVLAVVMVLRRAGEYALVRPGREMLYTAVAPTAKYKAKNLIDTVVYRGGDALSGWVKRGLDLLAEQPAAAMLIGSGVALAWAATGWRLARRFRARLGAAGGESDYLHNRPC